MEINIIYFNGREDEIGDIIKISLYLHSFIEYNELSLLDN